MEKAKTKTLEIGITRENYEAAHSFIGKNLKKNQINKEIIAETMLVFEALYQKILDQGFGAETLLTIRVRKSLGELTIKFSFEGKPFIPISEDIHSFSPEDSILQAYKDKTDYSYRSGYNLIRIVVKRNYHVSTLFCAAGILLAILVYVLISIWTDPVTQLHIEIAYVFPLLKLFANAALLIGTPVTFFSLLKNLTDTYIISERSFTGRKLQLKTVATSFISVLLALGASLFITFCITNRVGYLEGFGDAGSIPSFSSIVLNLLPDNLMKAFEVLSPFPLIIVALMIVYSLCSAGRYFDKIKSGIDACYVLFSKMLHIVMFALPFFCFVAVLYTLLLGGFKEVLVNLEMLLAIIISLVVMIAFYLIRLLIGGVKIGPFVKKILPLLWENLKISSAIDAVPYNIRYCTRNFGMDRKRISEKLAVLAQINLDGNSYLIMLCAAMFIFMLDSSVPPFSILVIAVLVVFLSFGAPNQPGSILIGMLIITLYLQAEGMITVAIFSEVFLGSFQNIINVAGDIVTIAIEEKKAGAAL